MLLNSTRKDRNLPPFTSKGKRWIHAIYWDKGRSSYHNHHRNLSLFATFQIDFNSQAYVKSSGISNIISMQTVKLKKKNLFHGRSLPSGVIQQHLQAGQITTDKTDNKAKLFWGSIVKTTHQGLTSLSHTTHPEHWPSGHPCLQGSFCCYLFVTWDPSVMKTPTFSESEMRQLDKVGLAPLPCT